MISGSLARALHLSGQLPQDSGRHMLLITTSPGSIETGEPAELPWEPGFWQLTEQGILLGVHSRQLRDAEIERLQDQASHLRRRLTELYSSNRYKLGDLLAGAWPLSRDTFALPLKILRLLRSGASAGLDESPVSYIPPLHGAQRQYRKAVAELDRFSARVREQGAGQVVFIFSGTTHIQDIKGNRPIRLARAWREQGIPVIFSYHRWKHSEKPAWSKDPGLLQLPVDMALRLARRIAEEDFGNTEKLFVVGYPLPPLQRHINQFVSNGWNTLYDCRDDWEEFWKHQQARWYDPAAEAYTVRNVDAVCCVADALVTKMQSLVPEQTVVLSQNAHDETLQAVERNDAETGERIVGYVGHMATAWFDWDLIDSAARQHPDISFEFIGHSAPADLELPPNVKLLGARPMHEVRKLAARWEAALIPFRKGKLSEGVDPIKVYEYLALGVPVLASGVSQARTYPGVRFASDAGEFVKMLERPASPPSPDELREFLARHTWRVRTTELSALARDSASRNPVHQLRGKQQ